MVPFSIHCSCELQSRKKEKKSCFESILSEQIQLDFSLTKHHRKCAGKEKKMKEASILASTSMHASSNVRWCKESLWVSLWVAYHLHTYEFTLQWFHSLAQGHEVFTEDVQALYSSSSIKFIKFFQFIGLKLTLTRCYNMLVYFW